MEKYNCAIIISKGSELKHLKDQLDILKKDSPNFELENFKLTEDKKSDSIKLIFKENEIKKLKDEIDLLKKKIVQLETDELKVEVL